MSSDEDPPTEFDHVSPPLSETEPEPPPASPKRGKAKKVKAKKVKAKKTAKRVKAAKKTKAPKVKKTKAAKEPKAKKTRPRKENPQRGVPKDGSPRKTPGTNPPKDEESRKFGAKVAKLRTAAGLTQRELAEKCGMGQPSIANIERGVIPAGSKPGGAREKLAKALKAPELAPKAKSE